MNNASPRLTVTTNQKLETCYPWINGGTVSSFEFQVSSYEYPDSGVHTLLQE
jgi:hypothetical protein